MWHTHFCRDTGLMIQIQSSWFPIIDRNPQRFIDTYHCTVEDFVMKQKIKIYHQQGAASRVILPVVKKIKREYPNKLKCHPIARAV